MAGRRVGLPEFLLLLPGSAPERGCPFSWSTHEPKSNLSSPIPVRGLEKSDQKGNAYLGWLAPLGSKGTGWGTS